MIVRILMKLSLSLYRFLADRNLRVCSELVGVRWLFYISWTRRFRYGTHGRVVWEGGPRVAVSVREHQDQWPCVARHVAICVEQRVQVWHVQILMYGLHVHEPVAGERRAGDWSLGDTPGRRLALLRSSAEVEALDGTRIKVHPDGAGVRTRNDRQVIGQSLLRVLTPAVEARYMDRAHKNHETRQMVRSWFHAGRSVEGQSVKSPVVRPQDGPAVKPAKRLLPS